ncbi:MAG: hypothetical protein Q8P39_00410 [Candidatus Yanofskybacteria bacterium]|nr:hypothetical protein [Candidatus Yanofskybacteria bacterium]
MLIFFYGTDSFRIRKKLKALKERYKEIAPVSLQVREWEEPDFSSVQQELETQSLFREKRFFVLRNWYGHSGCEEFLATHRKLFIEDENNIVVLVQEGELSVNPSLFAFLSESCALMREFSQLSGKELQDWAAKTAAGYKASLPSSVLDRAVAASCGDLWRLDQDIKKLAAYGKQGAAELIHTDASISIFQTLNAWGRKDTATALAHVRVHEQQGDSPLFVSSMLISHIRSLLSVQDLQERGYDTARIAKESGVRFPAKLLAVARLFTRQELLSAFSSLWRIERALKSGRIQGFFPLEFFIAQHAKRAS